MKFLVLFLSFFLAKSCNKELKQEMKLTTLEYSAVSRGYYLNITVADEKLSMTKKRGELPKEYTLTDKDWKELAELYKFVKLEEIPNYKAPSEKRFYDGAAIGTFRVTYDGKTYESQGFDHGNPPVEIAGIVNKLVSFSEPK